MGGGVFAWLGSGSEWGLVGTGTSRLRTQQNGIGGQSEGWVSKHLVTTQCLFGDEEFAHLSELLLS